MNFPKGLKKYFHFKLNNDIHDGWDGTIVLVR